MKILQVAFIQMQEVLLNLSIISTKFIENSSAQNSYRKQAIKFWFTTIQTRKGNLSGF